MYTTGYFSIYFRDILIGTNKFGAQRYSIFDCRATHNLNYNVKTDHNVSQTDESMAQCKLNISLRKNRVV